MATKRRRVKRRKTKRRQRGGAAPSKEGEKFKLNKKFDSYWDTAVKAAADGPVVLGEVAANTEVTWTGRQPPTGANKGKYVMKVDENKFIIAAEGDLEKVADAAATGVGAAGQTEGSATEPQSAAKSDATATKPQSATKKRPPSYPPPPPPGEPSAAEGPAAVPDATASTAAGPAAVPDAGDAAKIAELEKKLRDNWNCECKQKTSTTGGKKSRKRKNKKRARKNTRTKKRR